jgi:solute carrier family 4 (anion exchanger), member 1
MNHVRALTESRFNKEKGAVEIVGVIETRLTGFVIHAMMAGTLVFLPLLGLVPIPVVSGVFLFLGRKLMKGNSFLQRVRDAFVEKARLGENHPIQTLGRQRMTMFTLMQIVCLAGLWNFKQNPATAIFFPSVIGLLMVIRSVVLPKIFTEEELTELGDPTPSKHLYDGTF